MNTLKKAFSTPQVPLRLGLGLTYLYSGFGLIRNPLDWAGFAPVWFFEFIERVSSAELFFRVQGVFELVLALILLSWFLRPRLVWLASILGALHVAGILLFAGIDTITFRDIGLLGAWLALVSLVRE